MKDVLSFLVRKKKKALCATSCNGVLAAWLPVVEKMAAAKKQSSVETLCALLFSALSRDCETIYENGIHNEVETEDGSDEETKDKSGKLDKVSDDCVSHCLSFLETRDVLLNVELSCHRLFHVSRARKTLFPMTSIYLGSDNSLLSAAYNKASARMAALRIVTPSLNTEHIRDYVSLQPIEWLKEGVTSLRCDLCRDLELCAFPNLEHAYIYDCNVCDLALEFLKQHPIVRKFECKLRDCEWPAAMYTVFAAMKGLTHVGICVEEFEEEEIDESLRNVDLGHIKTAKLIGFNDWSLVRPFAHSQLLHLTLASIYAEDTPDFDLELPKLQTLRLDWKYCEDPRGVGSILERINAPNVSQLAIRCNATDVLKGLRLCPNAHVFLEICDTQLSRRQSDAVIKELRRECPLLQPPAIDLYLPDHASFGAETKNKVFRTLATIFAALTTVTLLKKSQFEDSAVLQSLIGVRSVSCRNITVKEKTYFLLDGDSIYPLNRYNLRNY